MIGKRSLRDVERYEGGTGTAWMKMFSFARISGRGADSVEAQ